MKFMSLCIKCFYECYIIVSTKVFSTNLVETFFLIIFLWLIWLVKVTIKNLLSLYTRDIERYTLSFILFIYP